MNRLSREFRRLYLPAADAPAGALRALVLEVARPANWQPLAAVWQGVQAELDLPAPAIAANGEDGLQLWFSLAEPVGAARADAFVEALCRRYLPELPAARRARVPARAPAGALAKVPAQAPTAAHDGGRWFAFLAPDLVSLFAETPWLDLPPNDEGQADLLARLLSIRPAQFEAAEAALASSLASSLESALSSELASAPVPAPLLTAVPVPALATPASEAPAHVASAGAAAHVARAFLLSVVTDAAAPLAQRIQAAQALLSGAASPGA